MADDLCETIAEVAAFLYLKALDEPEQHLESRTFHFDTYDEAGGNWNVVKYCTDSFGGDDSCRDM